ncbi:Transmembrane protein 87A [Larimichthys crocea]|uniref:Uncharacterized protein n=1 Tax=Larimichthys crocea TaxID=215358 RepID=A0ACD3QKL4_LARCR|nr:Transmembrane protein 87A [Larimichthys crocea]
MSSRAGPDRAGPGLRSCAVLLLLLTGLIGPVRAVSERGKWTVDIDSETPRKQIFFTKTLFNNSFIRIKLENCTSTVQLNVSWYLRNSHCYDEVFSLNFGLEVFDKERRLTEVQQQQQQQPPTEKTPGRRRRDVVHPEPKPAAVQKEGARAETGKVKTTHFDAVAKTWEDGPYMFILNVGEVKVKDKDQAPDPAKPRPHWSLQLQISMIGPHEYISASEWPLMVFYMVMCIMYVLLAVLWLVLSACYWRDLLRIQFWIGGVIFLGMLEKAVYYAEFQSIRYDGLSVHGAVVFAEALSAVKRTLARVLVIIASLGYGIVNLAQTMKLLKLRRNVVKLSLYRHFTNTLIFAVIASVIFIIWTTKTFRMSKCQSDWRELWIVDAFWRFLFSIILLAIMFLWRPSANNQRYAFSPLLDEESEEEEKEPMMNEAFEGMKMRGMKNESNGSAKVNKVDEDLKWVEENIPSSMADV